MVNRVMFLGTGAGDARSLRRKSSCLLEVLDTSILVDAGEPCARSIVSLGSSPERIDAVFLTHFHADHVGGLPLLVQTNHLAGRKNPLQIYAPGFGLDSLGQWLETLGLAPNSLGFPIELIPLAPGGEYPVGCLTIVPFATTHDSSWGRQSLGLSIRCGDKCIVFSGDLGAAGDLREPLAGNPQGLVCELAHIHPSALAVELQGVPLELLLLVHLPEKMQPEAEDVRRYLDEHLPLVKEIFVPGDGESFPFATVPGAAG